MDKTRVTITAQDGTIKELTGDTVICFAISGAYGQDDIVDAAVGFLGVDIPDKIFPETIGSLTGSLIEKAREEDPALASFFMFKAGNILQKMSKELVRRSFGHEDITEISKRLYAVLDDQGERWQRCDRT